MPNADCSSTPTFTYSKGPLATIDPNTPGPKFPKDCDSERFREFFSDKSKNVGRGKCEGAGTQLDQFGTALGSRAFAQPTLFRRVPELTMTVSAVLDWNHKMVEVSGDFNEGSMDNAVRRFQRLHNIGLGWRNRGSSGDGGVH